MDKINWSNYNYDEFELFCNALLGFEFGKDYQPFTAAGKDGGIDGQFTGTYQNDIGKWRFQFKFYLTSRNEAVSNLKFQLKKEAKKVQDEDYFVLATNVELLPQETQSIVDVFTEHLPPNSKLSKFLLWDGAKLLNLFIQYPILSHWLNEGFTTAQLRPYQDVYGESLDAEDFRPSSMSTVFIGRSNDLDNLHSFLDSNQQMAVISGEAGIGKTRLALEFFKSRVSKTNTWTALTLVNRNFTYDNIYRALYGERNYIIFIDDAHTFDPKVIADMRVIATQLKNVKLILTTRNIQVSGTLSLLKEYEREDVLQMGLGELSRVETEEVFLQYIGQTDYRHYINQLVETSFGKPILIVAMLNAMRKGIPINSIKAQNFLKSYVANYFDEYVERAHLETGIERINVRTLLHTVALLEPINFNDSEMIEKISSILGLDRIQAVAALNMLIDFGYVNGRYEQSIKPDFYSDIILVDIDPEVVVRFLTEFESLFSNIIINLSSVDEVKNEQEHILNVILQNYIKLIETSNDIMFVRKILVAISNIVFVKTDIAKETIDIYVRCLSNEMHPIRAEYEAGRSNNYASGSSAISTVITMLDSLYEASSNADYVYRRALSLYTITEEKTVINIFGFDKRDFLKHFNMERQEHFIGEFLRKFKKYSPVELTFGFQCMKGFAALDFTLTEWSAIKRDSIAITTYFLPNSGTVKKFRKRVIDALIKLYRFEEIPATRTEILKAIIDIPRGIFATSRNSKPYTNDAEVRAVLEFLKSEAPTFDLLAQKDILEKLHRFVKWGVSTELIPLIEAVKESLKPKNLVGRLLRLFSSAELSVRETPNMEQYVAEKSKEIVRAEDSETLALAIVELLQLQPHPPHYYWWFQRTLENEFPEYAKDLHKHLYESSMDLYSMYAPGILGTMYYHHQDHAFYWAQVEILENLDSVLADNVILMVYSQRVPDKTEVTKRDIEAIVRIFNKRRKENSYYMSMALQLLFASPYANALQVCQQFLERADQRQTEMFFIRLGDNKTVSEDQMADLIINHTVQYDLTYEIEVCLNLVLSSKGIDVVFDYLIKRFEYKRQTLIATRSFIGYEFLPDGEHSQLFNEHLDKRLPIFEKALEWYLNLEVDGGQLFYAKDMLTYLQPAKSLNQEMLTIYNNLFSDNSGNGTKMERILDSISIFHDKDETLLKLIVTIYPLVNDFQEADLKLYQRLKYACYNAITTMGVKSGTAGQPFQVDLDLKQLLETTISQLSEVAPSKRFFKDVLKSVDAEIERGRDRENLTW